MKKIFSVMGHSVVRRIFSIYLHATEGVDTSLVNQLLAKELLADIDNKLQETRKVLIKNVTSAKKRLQKIIHLVN